ncbi:MAG: hypothetical protein LBV19_06210 [Streptococcaceae bacterium]|jgi:predicted RNA binding protein with dsRBD fold (UPF0201 family)|nr:hypothetical protein [Streptococcaceae bacterium]
MNEALEHNPMQRREDSISRLDEYSDEYGHIKVRITNDSRSFAEYLDDWLIPWKEARHV